jgi:hypothetical protein
MFDNATKYAVAKPSASSPKSPLKCGAEIPRSTSKNSLLREKHSLFCAGNFAKKQPFLRLFGGLGDHILQNSLFSGNFGCPGERGGVISAAGWRANRRPGFGL